MLFIRILMLLTLVAACGPQILVNRHTLKSASEPERDNASNPAKANLTYYYDIRPIMDAHCVKCHAAANKDGKLALDSYAQSDYPDNAARWNRVLVRTSSGSMPPSPDTLLSSGEVETIDAWIKQGMVDGTPAPPAICSLPSGRTTMQRLTKTEYVYSLQQLLGINTNLGLDLPADASPASGFDNDGQVLSVSADSLTSYMEAASAGLEQALAVGGTKLLDCSVAGVKKPQDNACINRLISSFALQAFRRPASSEEINRLVTLATTVTGAGGSFKDGMFAAMQAALISPHFLYRTYGLSGNSGNDYLLSGYEMATRLAYFLWTSPPDQELLNLAEKGTLNTPEILRAQVARMLKDDRVNRFAENYSGQWLGTRNILSSSTVTKSPDMFPEFTDAMRADMKKETDMFFANLIKSAASPYDILTGRYTFINDRLATQYGIAGVTGGQFRKVSLEGLPRKGVTTQGSVLASNANATETSPTRRGYWILKKLTCNQPPPVPPDLTIPSLDPNAKTLREALAIHASSPRCAGCHALMDPIGLGYEAFGATGKYRTVDTKQLPVDSSGKLPSGQAFADHMALLDILSEDQQFPYCVSKKLMMYAVGRAMQTDDDCALHKIVDASVSKTSTFPDAINAIVLSDQFRKQKN